jgi:integrase/recombinase XerC
MTISNAVDEFLGWKTTHMDNPKAYRVALRPLIENCGDRETKDITIEEITAIVSRLTGNTFMFLTVLKIFARYCHWGNIPFVNPNLIHAKRKYDPTDRPHLTEEDIDMMCEVLDDDTFLGIRNQLIIRMLFQTGCRLSELLSIKVSDFTNKKKDEDPNCVMILTRKSKINRYIVWDMETHKLLLTYLGMRVSKDWKSDNLFIGIKGENLGPRGVQHMFNKVSKEAMGEVRNVHQTRHGKVHHLIADKDGKGVPSTVEIARILGHTGLESVLTYFRITAQESLRIAKKYI